MTVNSARQFVKALRKSQPTTDPGRLARAVVVSSTVGQSIITLDGGTTQVPAFNFAHTQSLAAGSVVRVLIIGNQIEVLGAFGAGKTTTAPPTSGSTTAPPSTSGTNIPLAPLGPSKPSAGYRLILADDFNGSSLDNNLWSANRNNVALNSTVAIPYNGYEQQNYYAANVSVANSVCSLTCNRHSGFDAGFGVKNFASGVISTQPANNPFLFSPQNAGNMYFEARVKIPGSATGSAGTVFPAFWIVTGYVHGGGMSLGDNVYTREMDFFEFGERVGSSSNVGNPNVIDSANIYPIQGYSGASGYASVGGVSQPNNNGDYQQAVKGTDYSQAFHLYTAQVTPAGQMTLWIDGAVQFTMGTHTAVDWMGLVFNYALVIAPGGSFTSDAMLIDYAAVWQDAGVASGTGVVGGGIAAGTNAP